MKRYIDFDDWQSVRAQFCENAYADRASQMDDVQPEHEPDHVFAIYEDDNCYGGSAMVVYFMNGKFYEVYGGHCSCHGLEGQWDPEESTPEVFLQYVERLDENSIGIAGSHKAKLLQFYREAMA